MKILGLALVLFGFAAFLKNAGVINVPMDWNIIWPLLVILIGSAIRRHKKCGSCKGGMCMGMGKCGIEEGHKCEGGDCGECKK